VHINRPEAAAVIFIHNRESLAIVRELQIDGRTTDFEVIHFQITFQIADRNFILAAH
jgi:hypothetical protein